MTDDFDDEVTGGMFIAALVVVIALVVLLGLAAWALVAWL